MARLEPIKKGTVSKLIEFALRDSTTGALKTGVLFSAITAKFVREGAASQTTVTALTMTQGTWVSGGFIETGVAGIYQYGAPDAAIATGSGVTSVIFSFTASGVLDKTIEIPLVSFDPDDAVRLGLTALPNANAEASGGLYTRGTGAGQINQDSNGRIDANTKAWIGGTIPAVNVTGEPLVDVNHWRGTQPNVLAGGRVDGNTILDHLRTDNGALVASTASLTTLATTAPSVDISNQLCIIYSGTGTFESRRITAYNTTTKAFTPDSNWTTTPGVGALYDIINIYQPVSSGTSAVNVTQVDGVALSTHAAGMFPADIRDVLGTAATAATAGVLDVNTARVNNVAATSVTVVSANLGTTQPVNFTGTGASALVKGDAIDWNSVAVTGMPMPTYTQPAGFLAATFPTLVASTTNITAGNITNVTGEVSFTAMVGDQVRDSDTIALVVPSPSTTAVTFTATDATKYLAGDVIQRTGSAELMKVTLVATPTITVTRGYAGTTAANISTGDTLLISRVATSGSATPADVLAQCLAALATDKLDLLVANPIPVAFNSSVNGNSIIAYLAQTANASVYDRTQYSLQAIRTDIDTQFTNLIAILPSGPSASVIAAAVWQDLFSGADFNTAGTPGYVMKQQLSPFVDLAISSRMATFTLPANFSSLGISAAGKINEVILTDTVTTLTNLPSIPVNWITAAGITAGALNGKGDWLLASSYTAPDNADIATILSRLGVPVNATISADIAEVEGETDAILTAVAAISINPQDIRNAMAGYAPTVAIVEDSIDDKLDDGVPVNQQSVRDSMLLSATGGEPPIDSKLNDLKNIAVNQED